MEQDDVELSADEIPEVVRAWLAEQSAVVVSIERAGDGRVLIRRQPTVDPVFLARLKVTLAKYREALMNLS